MVLIGATVTVVVIVVLIGVTVVVMIGVIVVVIVVVIGVTVVVIVVVIGVTVVVVVVVIGGFEPNCRELPSDTSPSYVLANTSQRLRKHAITFPTNKQNSRSIGYVQFLYSRLLLCVPPIALMRRFTVVTFHDPYTRSTSI